MTGLHSIYRSKYLSSETNHDETNLYRCLTGITVASVPTKESKGTETVDLLVYNATIYTG